MIRRRIALIALTALALLLLLLAFVVAIWVSPQIFAFTMHFALQAQGLVQVFLSFVLAFLLALLPVEGLLLLAGLLWLRAGEVGEKGLRDRAASPDQDQRHAGQRFSNHNGTPR